MTTPAFRPEADHHGPLCAMGAIVAAAAVVVVVGAGSKKRTRDAFEVGAVADSASDVWSCGQGGTVSDCAHRLIPEPATIRHG